MFDAVDPSPSMMVTSSCSAETMESSRRVAHTTSDSSMVTIPLPVSPIQSPSCTTPASTSVSRTDWVTSAASTAEAESVIDARFLPASDDGS